MNQKAGKKRKNAATVEAVGVRRRLIEIALLATEQQGKMAELGLGFAGQTKGVAVEASWEDVGHLARSLLFVGYELERDGASLTPMHEQTHSAQPLECSQMGVGSMDDGSALLTLRFGIVEVPVKVNIADIRRALALLDTAAVGGLAPPTATKQ